MKTTHPLNLLAAAVVLLTFLFFAGCASTKVERIDVDDTVDLSGQWNDTDSRLVSEEMIKDVMSRNWLERYKRAHSGHTPAVIVGSIRNRSDEHINTRTFVKDLERALVNSGEVDFVASSQERTELREERKDQDLHAKEETRKAMGQETGADFMMKGSINTIVDAIEGEQARFYQVDLALIDLESNRKVWVGQKKIKKTIEKGGLRW